MNPTLDRTDFEDTFTRILGRQQPRRCEDCGVFFVVPLLEQMAHKNGYTYPEWFVSIAGPWSCEDCR